MTANDVETDVVMYVCVLHLGSLGIILIKWFLFLYI